VLWGVLIGAVGAALFGVWLLAETWRFWHRFDGYQPDTAATPASAAEAAEFAGLDPTGLEVMTLWHSIPMDESWTVTWKGSPEAVDRFVQSGAFPAAPTPCLSVPMHGLTAPRTKLDGCLQVVGPWRQPDGDHVGRTVAWGRTPEGAYVVNLTAIGP
jgi:hypothetical protein